MTKEREALKLALEALENIQNWLPTIGQRGLRDYEADAITAIKEVLAQPEHSATYQKINLSLLKHSDNCRFWDEGDLCTCGASEFHELQFWKNKALAQPEMRPDEISTDELIYMSGRYDGIKQERALRELSRLGQEIEAQPEQEPVAWLVTGENINSLQVASIQRVIDRLKHAHHTDLCLRINGQDERFEADWIKHLQRATSPPQRPWVGLTDEEIAQGCKESWVTEQAWQSAVWWAEAKLKEKNFD